MPFPLADRLYLALAMRWPRWGQPAQIRMRAAARRGEPDMRQDPGEQVYGALYLDAIKRHAPAPGSLRILDAGCQAGRLAIPLAQAGHRVTGLDISADWLDRCRRNAEHAGVALALVQAGLEQATQHFDAGSFDLVICAEVLYTLRDPAAALRVLGSLLRPGGVLLASHRTRHYMLATLARYQLLADMAVVAQHEEGDILGGQYYNWFEAESLRRIYAQAGLDVRGSEGIGCVSGVGVDGMAAVLDPGELDERQRAQLLDVERACAARGADIARYRLVIAAPSRAAAAVSM